MTLPEAHLDLGIDAVERRDSGALRDSVRGLERSCGDCHFEGGVGGGLLERGILLGGLLQLAVRLGEGLLGGGKPRFEAIAHRQDGLSQPLGAALRRLG